MTLTAGQAPSQAPTLPATAPAGNLPSAAEIAALGAKYQACLALPVASRVTLDASGNVTAVSAACTYAPADWRSNGRTWAQEIGQFTFAKTLLSNARLGIGAVQLALAPENLSAANEFKHPYCNSGPCVVVRWPLTTAGGAASSTEWVLGKVNGQWDYVGNQRPYRSFVEPRLVRKININRNGAAPGNAGDPYFFKDRYESQLRLTFDLSVGDTSDVRAVRVSGPGLPAAGVVMFRSQRCGTDDRLGIAYQNGSTRVFNAPTSYQFWMGGATTDFVLDAANLDGTPLAAPTPVLNSTTASFQDFSPTPVANQAAVIPPWSRYKIEVFHYATLSDEPALVYYARTGTAAENAAAGVSKPWPTLNPAFASGYLDPTGNSAGAVSSTALSVDWTAQPGSYILSAYLFGQNFASATNAQNETANHGLRTRLDFEPAAYGNTTAPGIRFASMVAGTSMSSYTANSGTNPNPRCGGAPGVVPLTSNIADYREAGLSFRGTDRKLYVSIWLWDN